MPNDISFDSPEGDSGVTDQSTWLPDQAAQPDQAAPQDLVGPPDVLVPDQTVQPDASPPPVCQSWNDWDCSGILSCTATCPEASGLAIKCAGLGIGFCQCEKNSVSVGSCPLTAGAGCSMCELVFSCCLEAFFP